jgi:hypothetical protein
MVLYEGHGRLSSCFHEWMNFRWFIGQMVYIVYMVFSSDGPVQKVFMVCVWIVQMVRRADVYLNAGSVVQLYVLGLWC